MQTLLVEGDPFLRHALHNALRTLALPVDHAATTAGAMQRLATGDVRIVILDWDLPHIDPLQFCHALRRKESRGYTYLIAFTAQETNDHRLEALYVGVDDFLSKPLNPSELVIRIETAQHVLTLNAHDFQSKLTRLNLRLEQLVTVDPLTELYNRRHAVQRLDEQWALATRYGKPLTIAAFDIDYFSMLNDRLGKEAGDAVLKQVATILRSQAHTTDAVCRIAGQEFLVIFPTQTPAEAAVYAERVRICLDDKPLTIPMRGLVPVTLSAGITQRTPKIPTASALLQSARSALRAAKNAGRNCVAHFTHDLSIQAVA